MTEDVGAAINDGRRRDPERANLLLDFDGVLHPDEVYCVRWRIIRFRPTAVTHLPLSDHSRGRFIGRQRPP